MKLVLTWYPNGQSAVPSNFTLIDSPATIQYRNFNIKPTRSTQIVKPIRAKQPIFFDRGNRMNVISFDTTQELDTVPLAEAYLSTLETLFPGQFLVTKSQGIGGAKTSQYYPNSIVTGSNFRISGCTVMASFSITTGIVQSTPS